MDWLPYTIGSLLLIVGFVAASLASVKHRSKGGDTSSGNFGFYGSLLTRDQRASRRSDT